MDVYEFLKGYRASLEEDDDTSTVTDVRAYYHDGYYFSNQDYDNDYSYDDIEKEYD